MKCVSCGAEIEDNAQFCSECGAPVSPYAEKTLPLDPDKTHKMPAATSAAMSAEAAETSAATTAEATAATSAEKTVEMSSVDKASLHDQPTQFAPPVAATRVSTSDQSTAVQGAGQTAVLDQTVVRQPAPVGQHATDQPATKKGLSQNAKLGIIIGVVAAVVIVCGIIIAVLIMSHSAQQTETETTTQTQVEQQEQTTTQERAENTADTAAPEPEPAPEPSTNSNALVTHTNDRYGYSIDLPASFTALPGGQNGAGLSYGGGSTGQIQVDLWGENNLSGDTVADHLDQLMSDHNYIEAYAAAGVTWCVYSVEEDGMVYYYKVYVGEGSLNTALITYPSSISSEGDAFIERVIETFEPGDLSVAH